jgi:hypothetical protein
MLHLLPRALIRSHYPIFRTFMIKVLLYHPKLVVFS